jgi:L-Lysine epsilon oxidase N-terminal/L-lysine epsilon oxidase C-terminal domain
MPVRFEIYPAIGIARVGNSNEHFVFNGPASSNGQRRDAAGALLRQAAEFRIYKCERDAAGQLIRADEMTSANAAIQWSVHVSNRKAAAKQFRGSGRRNNSTGNDNTDRGLIIDSGEQQVSAGAETKSLKGAFLGRPVGLGEIRMVANGRLLVIGGDGSAHSPTNRRIESFSDNDGWFDTVSDGVIRAQITPNGGQSAEALAGWVIVAPPDYAPGIANLVTLYDVLVDLAITRNVLKAPETIVFSRHVRPILERAIAYQWVTKAARLGYADSLSGGHSSGGPGDFAAKMAQLGDPTAPNGLRARIFRFLRDPDATATAAPNLDGMPRLSDDSDTGNVFALTRTQYRGMLLWSHGQFVTDSAPDQESEPEALTRMALETCSGGPFFPGIEAGRIMRESARYIPSEAFRLSPDHVKPGEITQSNALPWQADYSLCRWEETDGAGRLKRLGWWPAQRPDDVLKDVNAAPVPWARGIADTFMGMVENWSRLGFVKPDPLNPGVFIERERDPALPAT